MINRVQLLGVVVRVTSTQTSRRIAWVGFTVRTSRRKHEEYLEVEAYGAIAEQAASLRVGDVVAVEARLTSARRGLQITADHVHGLGPEPLGCHRAVGEADRRDDDQRSGVGPREPRVVEGFTLSRRATG